MSNDSDTHAEVLNADARATIDNLLRDHALVDDEQPVYDAFATVARQAKVEALREMAASFRADGPRAWGGTWLTTGEHVADLVAGWCDEAADDLTPEATR